MEVESKAFQLHIMVNLQNCRRAACLITSFLDLQTLRTICQSIKTQQNNCYFLHLIRTHFFFAHYFNRLDRTMYYPFYEDEYLKQTESRQIALITESDSKFFVNYPEQYKRIMDEFKGLLPHHQDQFQQLQNMLNEPDLPLPKLKRETVGMYCNSTFQLFLVQKRFPNQYQESEFTLFENLQTHLQDFQVKYLKQFLDVHKHRQKQPENLQKIRKVRFTSFRINFQNRNEYLLPKHQLHNFIVNLFVLTELWLDSAHEYMRLIDNPMNQFVEFMLRYSIFRNFVLSVEENLLFVFDLYDSIYQEGIKDGAFRPKFCFWRPAMTKWLLKMQAFHPSNNKVYFHCLNKMRKQNRTQFLQNNSRELDHYTVIQNRLETNDFQEFEEMPADQYFETNEELYEIVTFDYCQYLVDVSINEQSVHWCGYSEHLLETPYRQFEAEVIAYNHEYFMYLSQLLPTELTCYILQQQINFLETLNIKPCTLKKMIQFQNKEIGALNQHQFFLSLDFESKDNLLKHFNDKAKICQLVDEDVKCFFSISPTCPPEEILIKSVHTADSDWDGEEEIYEYHSSCSEEVFKEDKMELDFNYSEGEDMDIEDPKGAT